MTKSELIAYLDAVCNAESAVYACQSAIDRLTWEINALKEPNQPALNTQPLPEKATPEMHSSLGKAAIIGAGIGWLSMCIYGGSGSAGEFDTQLHEIGTMLWIGVVAALIATLIIWVLLSTHARTKAHREAEENYARQTASIEKRNESLRLEYEWRMEIYNQQIQMITSARQSFCRDLTQMQRQFDSASAKLKRLYDMGVIYPGFRNSLSAFTLREYLKMGICTELEGPDGAYAQYMLDVRTARICDSIEKLRAAIVSAISQLQMALVEEINEVNQNVCRLGEGIQNELYQLGQSLQLSQQQATTQVTAHLAAANERLASIQAGTATIAINQYIANRMAGVDAYLC